MNLTVKSALPVLLCSLPAPLLAADNNSHAEEIERISIEASPTANKEPVGTFDSLVSNLDYDPRVDLQSRNMAEAQADVSIRGGIFENTGFRIGSATLFDPQTGHYVSELPIAPQMLQVPNILTGADNALYGMNSSVGTISFDWKPIRTGGRIALGAGSNNFNLQSVHAAKQLQLTESMQNWHLGVEGEFSRSASDGSIDNGDHHFKRASGRVQLADESSQTDLFFGLQEKFFGWPNLYTPFNVNETEDLETRLLMLNHQKEYAGDSSYQISAYYRRHNDHYIFSRENPQSFQTFHETQVKSIALSGHHVKTQHFAINYSTQFISDSIESSALENNFTSRNYFKASILPEYTLNLAANEDLRLRMGATYDNSNRDDSKVSLLGDLVWQQSTVRGLAKSAYLSYSQASQLPGYTAIGGSDSGGLFRSNYDLKRETSTNIEMGISLEQDDWRLNTAVFYRQDDNLTDWTYNFDSTSARYANPVDIDTTGLELLATQYFDQAQMVLGYTFLRKSEDYGAADIDASFYALNYPSHRITLGAIWQPLETLEVRLDNEWRKQQDNLLRGSDDDALFTHLTLTMKPEQFDGLMISLAADNIWNESFEEVPGTPGRGEQYTLSATYNW